MKFIVKIEGGPSPGVTIAGERNELILLANQLRAGAESTTSGTIPMNNIQIEGEPHEWIAFEVVTSLSRARDEQEVKAAPAKIAVLAVFVLFAGLCYLAYRGLRTF